MTSRPIVVRTPASSANLGAGFDVLGLAVGLHADLGTGTPPEGARVVDEHHPGRIPFTELGGTGPIWLRTSIPMARGLGFSGAVRVGAAALAVVSTSDGDTTVALARRADEILEVAARLEGHGDNVAASLRGGVTAYVDGRIVPIPVGPVMSAARFVAWIPDVTTSTDRSRRTLSRDVERAAAVANIGAALQFSMAFVHDDPDLLDGATRDHLHQAQRLPLVPGAAEALDAGVAAGAWCGWLSGSGPTVGFLADAEVASHVSDALPDGGHVKVVPIDLDGAHVLDD